MRDFENLEELSSAVQSGLKANDVIWAIDLALASKTLDASAKGFLVAGGQELRQLADPEPHRTAASRRNMRNMLGNNGQRKVRQVLAASNQEDVSTYLNNLADTLDRVATEGAPGAFGTELETISRIFSIISDLMLGQASGIVRTRKEPASWPQPTMISPSS